MPVGGRPLKPPNGSTDNGRVILVLIVVVAVAVWLPVVLLVVGLCRQAARADRGADALQGEVHNGPGAADGSPASGPASAIAHGERGQWAERRGTRAG